MRGNAWSLGFQRAPKLGQGARTGGRRASHLLQSANRVSSEQGVDSNGWFVFLWLDQLSSKPQKGGYPENRRRQMKSSFGAASSTSRALQRVSSKRLKLLQGVNSSRSSGFQQNRGVSDQYLGPTSWDCELYPLHLLAAPMCLRMAETRHDSPEEHSCSGGSMRPHCGWTKSS